MSRVVRSKIFLTCVAAVVVTGACGPSAADREAARKVDPNLPAVVEGPPIILPSDTAKPDTMPAHRERIAEVTRELLLQYSFIGAATVLGDRRMLGTVYDQAATLKLADSSYTGAVPSINAMVEFFRRASVTEMVRQPRVVNGNGLVFTDSGDYVIISKREGARPQQERGTYVATWHRVPTDVRWMLAHDEIIPAPAKPR